MAALPVLTELCLPLVKPGGQFLAMKSVDSNEELNAAGRAVNLLGGRLEKPADYTQVFADLPEEVHPLALGVQQGQLNGGLQDFQGKARELNSAGRAVNLLGGRLEKPADYSISGTNVPRRLVIMTKITETQKKYPRTFAKIKKNPL